MGNEGNGAFGFVLVFICEWDAPLNMCGRWWLKDGMGLIGKEGCEDKEGVDECAGGLDCSI